MVGIKVSGSCCRHLPFGGDCCRANPGTGSHAASQMQVPARTHDRCLCLSHEWFCISATNSFIFFSGARSNAPNSGACSNASSCSSYS
jgi:hypothetical protein